MSTTVEFVYGILKLDPPITSDDVSSENLTRDLLDEISKARVTKYWNAFGGCLHLSTCGNGGTFNERYEDLVALNRFVNEKGFSLIGSPLIIGENNFNVEIFHIPPMGCSVLRCKARFPLEKATNEKGQTMEEIFG